MLFEDERYLAVNKPPGLLVHRTPIDAHETENLRDLLKGHHEGRLDPVHRLDKPTPSWTALRMAPRDHRTTLPTVTLPRPLAGSISMPCSAIQRTVS